MNLAIVKILRHRSAMPDSLPTPSPYHHGSLPTALLGAAEAILERDGFQALTLRAVARATGVSHAAPAHHFGDLSGLLSDLAATGYVRFRAALLAEMEASGPAAKDRLHAMGCGYVRFASDHPNLFRLMFRSERLDRSRPALQDAMRGAFAALAEAASASAGTGTPPRMASGTFAAPGQLADSVAAWAIAHGLALLLIDGRLRSLVDDSDSEALIGAALSRLRL